MPLTYFIIAITVVTSLLAWSALPRLLEDGMLFPFRVFRENKWYQLLSSGFLHADMTHLLFNMITLFFFGPVLEQTIGGPLFGLLYLSSLVVSSLPTLIRHRDNPNYASLGASGAVEAVIFSFIVFYPFEPLYLFFIPIGIPAILFGFLFIGYSIYAGKKQGGNINHDAHIAGSAWGLVFTLLTVPYALDHLLTMLNLI